MEKNGRHNENTRMSYLGISLQSGQRHQQILEGRGTRDIPNKLERTGFQNKSHDIAFEEKINGLRKIHLYTTYIN